MRINSNLSEKQKSVVERFYSINSKTSKKFVALPAAPGSGKTTTLVSSLENFFLKTSLKKDTNKTINGDINYFFKDYESPSIKEEFSLEELHNPNQQQKILILAFNKNAIDDFIKKADVINIPTIVKDVTEDGIEYYTERETKMSLLFEASTYHSLLLRASKPIIEKSGYIPDYSKANFYKKDIAFINNKHSLELKKDDIDYYFSFIEKYHNSPMNFTEFCRNWKNDYPAFNIDKAKAIQFVINSLYAEMSKQNITMPHCFYYKLVHQEASKNPEFLKSIFKDSGGNEFNFILVDEAQDSDAIIYDLIKKSNKKSVFVGDTYQNIYGFRGTFNVFEDLRENEQENTDFYDLNESYRYGKAVATFTSAIPNTLGHTSNNTLSTIGKKDSDYVHNKPFKIEDLIRLTKNKVIENQNNKLGKKETSNQIAIICRSNKRALEIYSILKENETIAPNVKIESGLKSKTKDFVSKGLSAIEDEALREQINNILGEGNFSFDSMINNDEVTALLANTEYSYLLKCKDEKLKNAMLQKSSGYETITIITVHGSKGLEYQNVIVADDYVKKDDSPFILPTRDEDDFDIDFSNGVNIDKEENSGLSNDEINIIYTATTRAKESLFVMESPLFNMLKEKIIEASKYNNNEIAKKNYLLLSTDVNAITEEKASKKAVELENKKNIIEEVNLFNM